MPQGLQVFDSGGNLTLDVTERLTVLVGTATANGSDGSVYVGALPAGSFWALVFPTTGMFATTGNTPNVTYENGYVVWRYSGWSNNPASNITANLMFGVF